MSKLQIIGGGKMGEALLAGLIGQGWATEDQLAVVEKETGRAEALRAGFPGIAVVAEPAAAAGHVIAVKPPDVFAVCAALKALRDRAPVLSIAAGVTIGTMEGALAPTTPVVRAMPNTAALVGASASAVAFGQHTTDEHVTWAEEILGAVGTVVQVTESLLDAVTGLSGSGPAYLLLVLESMIDGGVHAGLARPDAAALATQTLVGVGKMLAETGEPPVLLRASVTSPAGTTAAGVRELERGGVRAALIDAVLAATERSRELGLG